MKFIFTCRFIFLFRTMKDYTVSSFYWSIILFHLSNYGVFIGLEKENTYSLYVYIYFTINQIASTCMGHLYFFSHTRTLDCWCNFLSYSLNCDKRHFVKNSFMLTAKSVFNFVDKDLYNCCVHCWKTPYNLSSNRVEHFYAGN